jgi:hypothetical protein
LRSRAVKELRSREVQESRRVDPSQGYPETSRESSATRNTNETGAVESANINPQLYDFAFLLTIPKPKVESKGKSGEQQAKPVFVLLDSLTSRLLDSSTP